MERVLSDPGFADDTGGADPEFAAALRASAAGDPGPLAHLLPAARLLVPIVAILDEVDERGAEKSTDMAVVTLKLTDGRIALPAFTSLDALALWHADARPLPIDGVRAAQATIFEKADLLLIDPAGPVSAPIAGPALATLAAGIPPLPVDRDPEVADALRAQLSVRPAFRSALFLPSAGGESDAILGLVLRDDETDAAAAVADLSEALARDPVLASRLALGLDLALLPPGTELPAERLY